MIKIILCIALLMQVTVNCISSSINCSGLALERLSYGFALTESGIVFAVRIGDSYAIYEHKPYASPDLLFVSFFSNLNRIVDIQYSNSFAVYTGNEYLICEPEMGLIVNHARICESTVIIYERGSKFIFVCYSEENNVASIYELSDGAILVDITEEMRYNDQLILDCIAREDGCIILMNNGLYECSNKEKLFTSFENGIAIPHPSKLILCGDDLYLIYECNGLASVSKLKKENGQVEIVESRQYDNVPVLFYYDNEVLIANAQGDLISWDSNEIVQGCENAVAYFQLGDNLFGIQRTSILETY